MTHEEIISAARRSERAWCEQISEWESQDYGVAHWSPAFPDLPDAQQLRDVWLGDAGAEAVFAQAEGFYADRGARCLRWVPAAGQPIGPIEALLAGAPARGGAGWRRRDLLALGLSERRVANGVADRSIRVLPARAMPKAYRAALAEGSRRGRASVAAGLERLNDAKLDAFVAMVEGEPAGRIGYLEVGDIARLVDLCVAPGFHERGVGGALVAHFMAMVRRLGPRVVVACIEADDTAGRSILEAGGFNVAGPIAQFDRPRIANDE